MFPWVDVTKNIPLTEVYKISDLIGTCIVSKLSAVALCSSKDNFIKWPICHDRFALMPNFTSLNLLT